MCQIHCASLLLIKDIFVDISWRDIFLRLIDFVLMLLSQTNFLPQNIYRLMIHALKSALNYNYSAEGTKIRNVFVVQTMNMTRAMKVIGGKLS